MINSMIRSVHERVLSGSVARAFCALLTLFAATGALAVSPAAQAADGSPTGSGSTTLTPLANAYTRDGTYSSNNYGGGTYIDVRSGSTNYNEISYFQFNTAGLSTNIVSATLYVYGLYSSSTSGAAEPVTAYGVANTPTWTETGITAATAPALTTAGGTTTVSTAKTTYSWDVTSWLRSQATSGAATTSLALKTSNSNNSYFTFYSRSNSLVAPYLVVTYGAAPSAPSLTGTVGNQQATLNWGAVTGATSYNLYRALASQNEGTTPFKTGVTSPYVDSGLTNGTAYYYYLTAVDAVGESVPSNEVSVTPTLPPAIPDVPTNVTATSGAGTITIAWSAAARATSYNVKRSYTSGGPYTTIASPTTASYVDNSVASGTTAYYVVSGVNWGGESANSAEVSAAPTAALPAAPTNLTANGSNEAVHLAWTASPSATTYLVERATNSGGPYTVIAKYVTGTIYTDYDIANDQAYYYVLASVDNVGTGPVSNEAAALPSETYTLTATQTAAIRDGSYVDTPLGSKPSMWTYTSQSRQPPVAVDVQHVQRGRHRNRRACSRVWLPQRHDQRRLLRADDLYPVLSDTWQQSTVTWDTKPAVGTTSVGAATITDNAQYYDWDVTSYVQSKLAAGATLADLAMIMPVQSADSDYNVYNSEAAKTQLPLLVITTASPTVNMQVNFQPASSTTPTGWTADTGELFNAATGMGWVSVASMSSGYDLPIDMTGNTYDRMQSGVVLR